MLSDELQAWLAGLTVAKLRTELKARDLATTGLKAELAGRLRDALEAQAADQGDAGKESHQPPDQVEGDGPSGAEANAAPVADEVPDHQDTPATNEGDKQQAEDDNATPAAAASAPAQQAEDDKATPAAAANTPADKHSAAAAPVAPASATVQQPAPSPTQHADTAEVTATKPSPSPVRHIEQQQVEHTAADQEEVDYGVDSEEQHAPADEEATKQGEATVAASAAPAAAETATEQATETAGDVDAETAGKAKAALAAEPQKQQQPDQQAVTQASERGQTGTGRSSEDGGKRAKRAPILFQPKSKQAPPAAAAADVVVPAGQAKSTDKSDAAPAPTAVEPAASPAKQPSAALTTRASSGALPSRGAAAAPSPQPLPPPKGPATQAFRLDNLVRPFTEANLRQLISETGTIVDLWMPSIKTHAYVILESEEQAEATCAALHGSNWPAGSPKRLTITYLSLEEAQDSILLARDPRAAPGRAVTVSRASGITARLSASKQQQQHQQAAAMDVDLQAEAPEKETKDTSESPPHLKNGEEEAEGDDVAAKPDAEMVPNEQAGKEAAVKPAAKVGLGAVAAAKAALSAAAGQGHKRAHAGSQEEDEPSTKRIKNVSAQQKQQQHGDVLDEAVLSLDTLFKKTAAKPHLYWLPLTDEEVRVKKARLEREEEEQRKLEAAQASGLPPRLPLAQRYPHLAGFGPGAPYMGRRR